MAVLPPSLRLGDGDGGLLLTEREREERREKSARE
jgi:hypothetical protein